MLVPRALACVLVLSSALAAQRPLNLLFYGNSYSADNASVPALVGAIAQTAGVPARIVARIVGGTGLSFHQTDPQQVAAIWNSLTEDGDWDFVVMQGLSTEATVATGNPTAFRAAAVGIVANVRAHSPGARAVLYQTWARAHGHSYYPTTFANPMAMHAEVRANYQRAVEDIDRAFGPGTARLARAGDAVAHLAFDPALYTGDLGHPARPITLVAGMAVFSALWQEPVCGLTPVFTQQTPIGRHFIGNGFAPALWNDLRGYADVVRDRRLRPFPGSGEDLLLFGGTGGTPSLCSQVNVQVGSTLALALKTPNGLYGSAPAAILLGPAGLGPHPVFSELFVGQAATVTLGVQAAVGNGLAVSVPIPPGTANRSLMVQGLALAPSLNVMNPWFTTADALEIRIR